MKNKKQSLILPTVKELGVRGNQAEHDLLTYAATLCRQTRNAFILSVSIAAAKQIVIDNGQSLESVPASKPWKK